jgi:hypothetical protein
MTSSTCTHLEVFCILSDAGESQPITEWWYKTLPHTINNCADNSLAIAQLAFVNITAAFQ